VRKEILSPDLNSVLPAYEYLGLLASLLSFLAYFPGFFAFVVVIARSSFYSVPSFLSSAS
jgi:hypothetical protein